MCLGRAMAGFIVEGVGFQGGIGCLGGGGICVLCYWD